MIRWKIHAYQSADPFNKKPFGIYWKFNFDELAISYFSEIQTESTFPALNQFPNIFGQFLP